jgi:predicted AlkP superfamily pyrophosphatase or phosphodiesterase
MRNAFLLGAMFLANIAPSAASAAPVLFISIDGLRPGDVLDAEKRGLKIPNLRRFVREGSYASAVKGVLPTVTYPSHATLLTGASPARHGIVNNTSFDPMQINQGGWYWYASDLKLPTLWDAAAKAGLSTANVHWPTSVGAKSIRWNLPQYWRTGHTDDLALMKALSTPGLVDSLEQDLKLTYALGISESIEGDENRGAFAVHLISREKPGFATVYLTALDHEQHVSGPDATAAHVVLERIDVIIGKLIAAELAAHPDAVVAVASDHGFAATTSETNLFKTFIDAGLITVDPEGKVTAWEAMPWPSGGSNAVVLARPADALLQAKVRDLLARLKADPAAHIDGVIEKGDIDAMGGNTVASFYVNLAIGALAGSFKGTNAVPSGPSKYKGMHGYFPAAPEMRSTFMMMGASVPRARNLGEIDMRSIAPTLAKLMNTSLPTADLPPLK